MTTPGNGEYQQGQLVLLVLALDYPLQSVAAHCHHRQLHDIALAGHQLSDPLGLALVWRQHDLFDPADAGEEAVHQIVRAREELRKGAAVGKPAADDLSSTLDLDPGEDPGLGRAFGQGHPCRKLRFRGVRRGRDQDDREYHKTDSQGPSQRDSPFLGDA